MIVKKIPPLICPLCKSTHVYRSGKWVICERCRHSVRDDGAVCKPNEDRYKIRK